MSCPLLHIGSGQLFGARTDPEQLPHISTTKRWRILSLVAKDLGREHAAEIDTRYDVSLVLHFG
jgi:hypothetical protein